MADATLPRLHVNCDHVATVRQARHAAFPDPVEWALLAEGAGAQGITVHLRKDRRHIQDHDVLRMRRAIGTLLNLELSLDPEIVAFTLECGADEYCIVPENRQEITTEGGLDVVAERARLSSLIPRLHERGGDVSLFVDPDQEQLRAASDLGARFVELHTGTYANAAGDERARELERLCRAAAFGAEAGLRINAGHGLDYENVVPVAAIEQVEELNIGHSIVSRSLMVGAAEAVREMLALVRSARG